MAMEDILEAKKAPVLFLPLCDAFDLLDTLFKILDMGGGKIRVFWQRMGFNRFSGLPFILIRFICLQRSSCPLKNRW
jgi:hypothetical protein